MYERLTDKRIGHGGFIEYKNYDKFAKLPNEREIYDRLCDLEDKIEQGKIVELPFKLGGRKRLYYPVKGTNTILETRVFGIGIDDEGDVIFNPTEYPEKVIEMRGVEIGKTVFLDRASAEAKLREMEGDNNE